ncbi:transcription factor GTE3, chloroplastic [Brassica napus]|uniref:transcription factor GTE3, chloroplastic n=1 Tax=Brassica napus TaxID=3708 RepID=UPI0006AAFF48|nr:transcription factor GTE3, chloroplastic [Brassica napus]
MASGALVSKAKHKRSEISNKRLKPTTAARPVSPSNSEMRKITLNSISKLQVRDLKRKLTAELEKVRSLINRLEPVPNKGGQGKAQILKSCNSLLTKLMKHKFGWIFNTPVDAVKSGLHDYHTIVKKPMDLGTVKTRLSKSWYESPLEFAEDVRLTFNNALLYNPVGHDVHRMAQFLLNMFEDKWAPLETQCASLYNTHHYVESLPLQAPPPVVVENRTLERAESMTNPVEPLALTVSPEKCEEEEASGNRDLTFEEKRRLSEDLQDLPFDKLEEVVEIIKKTKPELAQQDDEIELDIDSLDLQTLWELYRFVIGYKESLSNKKEEQRLGSERDVESVQEPNTLVTGPESTKVTELGHVASPAQQVNAGVSSSSSSGSGSSSDSDSDSSGHGS